MALYLTSFLTSYKAQHATITPLTLKDKKCQKEKY